MEDLLRGFHTTTVATCLSPPCLGCLRLASRGVRAELNSYIAAICHKALEAAVPAELARDHYREVLGVSEAIAVLSRRRWLQQAIAATTWSQWRTETAVARLMIGVRVDESDLFSALKRAFLASQVPSLANSPGVVRWMNVLGAVEEQDPLLMKLLAREAWEAVIGEVGVASQTLLWVVQHAHFVAALDDVGSWLLVKGGPSIEELTGWLQSLKQRLEENPSAGRYGPPGDTSQVRATHVSRIMRALSRAR